MSACWRTLEGRSVSVGKQSENEIYCRRKLNENETEKCYRDNLPRGTKCFGWEAEWEWDASPLRSLGLNRETVGVWERPSRFSDREVTVGHKPECVANELQNGEVRNKWVKSESERSEDLKTLGVREDSIETIDVVTNRSIIRREQDWTLIENYSGISCK